jgi:hypothetical protein
MQRAWQIWLCHARSGKCKWQVSNILPGPEARCVDPDAPGSQIQCAGCAHGVTLESFDRSAQKSAGACWGLLKIHVPTADSCSLGPALRISAPSSWVWTLTLDMGKGHQLKPVRS